MIRVTTRINQTPYFHVAVIERVRSDELITCTVTCTGDTFGEALIMAWKIFQSYLEICQNAR